MNLLNKQYNYGTVFINDNYNINDIKFNVYIIKDTNNIIDVRLPRLVNVTLGTFIYIKNMSDYNVNIKTDDTIDGQYTEFVLSPGYITMLMPYLTWYLIEYNNINFVPDPVDIAQYHQIYVDKLGSDTNSGNIAHPYLTIGKALSTIGSGLYVINVGVGNFMEEIELVPNVIIKGISLDSTFIGDVIASTDGLYYLSNVTVESFSIQNGSINLNNVTVTNESTFECNVYANNCVFNNDININGNNTQLISISNSNIKHNTLNLNTVLYAEINDVQQFFLNLLNSGSTMTVLLNSLPYSIANNSININLYYSCLPNNVDLTGIQLNGNFNSLGVSYVGNAYPNSANNVNDVLEYINNKTYSSDIISPGNLTPASIVNHYNQIDNIIMPYNNIMLPDTTNNIGTEIIVKNNDSTNNVNIYPYVGQKIGNLGINNPFVLSPECLIKFYCYQSNEWQF